MEDEDGAARKTSVEVHGCSEGGLQGVGVTELVW